MCIRDRFWGFREVFGLHEDVFQDEEQRQDVHHGADLFCPAGDGVDGHIGDNSLSLIHI